MTTHSNISIQNKRIYTQKNPWIKYLWIFLNIFLMGHTSVLTYKYNIDIQYR